MTDLFNGISTIWNNFSLFGIGNELLMYILILIIMLAPVNMEVKNKVTIATALSAGLTISGIVNQTIVSWAIMIGLAIWAIILNLE